MRFFVELMQQALWIQAWLLFLISINLASLVFLNEPLAQIVFAVFITSAMLMTLLYSIFGFEKILGMGHVLWIPLLPYILLQIPSTTDTFKAYLIVLSVFLSISLLFDITDVWKYFLRRNKKSTPA